MPIFRDKGAEGGRVRHQRVMTATPIPRTLAMAAYADLDVSAIDGLPPGRTPVQPVVLGAQRRPELIERIRTACAEGRQAYWVCTISDDPAEIVAQAAQSTFELPSTPRPALRVGFRHGRIRAGDPPPGRPAVEAGTTELRVGSP